jgi:protein-disulfide isomerase
METAREKAKALGVVGTPNILFSDGRRVQHAMSVNEIRDVVFKE